MPPQSSEVLFVIGGAFALAALAIFVSGFFPAARKSSQDLWATYLSEFFLVGAIIIPAALGAWVFTLLLMLVAARGQFELARLFTLRDWSVPQLLAVAVGALVIACVWLGYAGAVPALLGLGVVVITLGAFLSPVATRALTLPVTVLGLLFPVLCCVMAAALRNAPQGFVWIVVAYAIVEINDASALLAGKLFGTRRILPRLSPGKTAEGLATGIAIGGASGIALGHWLLDLPLPMAAFLAMFVLVAGIVGDLGTSALKRARGQKDFSPVLRRHGGVLDIYDAFLAAAPAAYVFRVVTGV